MRQFDASDELISEEPAREEPIFRASADELLRMEEFLVNRVDPVHIKHTYQEKSGRKIDCVELAHQPAMRNPALRGHTIEETPPPLPIDLKPLPGTAFAELPPDECPVGTVSIEHLDLETLGRFKSLEAFFRKAPEGIPMDPDESYATTPGHEYARIDSSRSSGIDSSYANFNVWKTTVGSWDQFSLVQVWLSRGSGAPTNSKQTLEAGLQVYNFLYGDNNCHNFIFSTRNNYAGSDPVQSGCYNNSCGDFVKAAGTPAPGWACNEVSQIDGTQWTTPIIWLRAKPSGNWWLYVGGMPIGYYPSSLYDTDGLKEKASRMSVGGEMAYHPSLETHPTTDMGSGQFANKGFGKAAFVAEIMRRHVGAIEHIDAPFTGRRVTDSDCYSLAEFPETTGTWGSHIYYGGPGKNSNCPNTP